MNNIHNCIEGIDIKEPGFECLKNAFLESYDLSLMADILSLSCINETTRRKILTALLRDNSINDAIMQKLCKYLENISLEGWKEMEPALSGFVSTIQNRAWQLYLVHVIETLYAKNLINAWPLLFDMYRLIEPSNNDFSPNSEENVRIKCARIAYSTNNYNYKQKLEEINALKENLKISENRQLLGMVFYYKGLCLKDIRCYDKDITYFMQKSRDKGYRLAGIYLDYHFNFETSR